MYRYTFFLKYLKQCVINFKICKISKLKYENLKFDIEFKELYQAIIYPIPLIK